MKTFLKTKASQNNELQEYFFRAEDAGLMSFLLNAQIQRNTLIFHKVDGVAYKRKKRIRFLIGILVEGQ
jgi:hypothetical protein